MILGVFFFVLPAAVLAIVFGHLSRSEIRRSQGRLRGSGMAMTGLVFGYLGASLIPLIIAAIAIPNLLRSKMAANEASAVGSLRTITTAAISYSSIYGDGFPVDLPTIGGPARATHGTCDSALLIDSVLSTPPFQKSGYAFTYAGTNPVSVVPTGCTNPGWNNFTVTAVPISVGSTGQRGFFVDETGVIRFTTDGSVPTSESPSLQ